MSVPFRRAGSAAAVAAWDQVDGKVARRGRLAGAALVVVLLAVSMFAVWSSQATDRASSRAVLANGLSDDY